jgi:hypothetical protein
MSTTPSSRVPVVLRVFGAVLLVIGALGYLLPAPPVHWTAMIPAMLGAAAFLLSLAARRPALAAAGGAVVAGVALFGGASALPHLPAVVTGEVGAAIAARAATALAAILALAGLIWAQLGTRRRAAA